MGNPRQKSARGKFSYQNKGLIRKMSSKTGAKEGRNLKIVIADEVHEMKDNTLIEPLRQAVSTQDEPLYIEITTEGFIQDGYLDQRLILARKVLTGEAAGEAAKAVWSGVKSEINLMEKMTESKVDIQTKLRIVEPVVMFPQNYGAQAYLGNTFFIYRTRLSDDDMERADNFFTQYGYAQDKRIEVSDLTNRTYFNYIKASGISINSDESLSMRQLAADTLNSGVRLWHVMPSPLYMTDNP